MTREEGVILSAYTGYLLVDKFDDVHKFIEDLLGRPVWTHEFADRALLKEIQRKCKHLLPAVKEEPRWIPVTEDLPKVWQHPGDDDHIGEPIDFIVFIRGALVPTSLWFNGRCFCDAAGLSYDVTHWMHFPEPPKGE